MEKKLRYSRQREMIYQYLLTSEEHPSAETVYNDLKPEMPELSLGTVYRNLKLLEELGKDYVRTAHSRGNDRRAILYRHVLRNAVVPTVAFLAMTIADIVAGSVVIEQVFAIPGMGRLLFSSISNRDYPVVQAVIVLMAFWVVLVNFLADMINQRLDPRLRLQ